MTPLCYILRYNLPCCGRIISNLYAISGKNDGAVMKLCRSIHAKSALFGEASREKRITTTDIFYNEEKRDRETFMNVIDIFKKKKYKTGHVEFIYSALKRMEEYGVHEDLEAYRELIDVMPKERFTATNMYQAEGMFYPKHQQCIVDLLLQMEENHVMPDRAMEGLLLSIFGKRAHPLRRYWRMMYWMPKFRYASPWTLPDKVPKDAVKLAKLAISRMCTVDLESELSFFQTKDVRDASDDTWIVSGQSPMQRTLLEKHPRNVAIYVEGGFKIYLRKSSITYFVLRADFQKNRRKRSPKDPDAIKDLKVPYFDPPNVDDMIPKLCVHEQTDGIIYAIAATGTSSRDSLLSWIRLLEKNGNPNIANIPVIFKSDSPLGNVQNQEELEEGFKLPSHVMLEE